MNDDLAPRRRRRDHLAKPPPAILSVVPVSLLFDYGAEWPRWVTDAKQRCEIRVNRERGILYVETIDGAVVAYGHESIGRRLSDDTLYVLPADVAARYVEAR